MTIAGLSDSEDDQPIVARAKKEPAAAPAVKKEAKPEAKEEGEPGPKPGTAKAPAKEGKEEGKKPAAAPKGKAAVKAEDTAANGKAKEEAKKAKPDKQPREKKEYDMPGQTREPPPENDSLRKFYTSLLEQRPDSDMAKRWCLTHGLLSRDVAEELVAQLKKGKPVAK
ncbi:hypothetical protein GPECTOR_2g976 [Gonium pectorale]|uniref:Uncharacterized protein n=1 Tax=Gonium pectorale TaxID=33097 RepID=A0A150H205_GONPE|nr:hypothetical protein GPECTOR_2g976 [Gonium pectorale]|eukprot:KXZ56094.1 hypothetical protein GPECTOR_2g976 [Gonium pectorale]